MNVFQIQEQLRTAPDDYLVKEMQQPTGMAPQYLVLTELQRRQQLRQGVGAQMPTTTVAQDLAAGIGGGQRPEIPNAANQPQPPSMAAMQGSTAPQKSSFASGGMVGEEKEGFFDGLNPLMGGAIPWALNKMGGDDGWQLGAIGLMNQLFGDKKKEQLPGQVPANPMEQQPVQRFAGGGQPQDPQQAAMWRNFTGMEIPEWLKRKIQFETDMPAPEKPRPSLSVPDWLQGIDPVYQRIVGPESQGKDVNSVASKGAYIGPGQMNADSYKDALRYAKKRYPDMKFPAWNEDWKKTTPENRPKDYPTMREWALIGEGYVDFIRETNKQAGVPIDDAHIYGGWNAGVGNLQKLFNNPDTPIKDLLKWKVIDQNKFDPNAKYKDMIKMWGGRLDRHSGPAAKEVVQTPSKKFFYVPEGEDASMSENDMINEMFSADDPDQAILDKIKASAEQATANKEAAALTGIAKMLEGSPMIPPQAPPPMPRPKPAPQRMVAPQDQKTAEDILNDMQYRAAQNQRIRKQRLGYAQGGIVGYAEGTGDSTVGRTVVHNGMEYKYRGKRNGKPIWTNAQGQEIPVEANPDYIDPIRDAPAGMSKLLSMKKKTPDEFSFGGKEFGGGDSSDLGEFGREAFLDMVKNGPWENAYGTNDPKNTPLDTFGRALATPVYGLGALTALTTGVLGDTADTVAAIPKWLTTPYGEANKKASSKFVKPSAPVSAPTPQPSASQFDLSKPITDATIVGQTQAELDSASRGGAGSPSGVGGLAEYMKQIQSLRGEPKEDPRMEALYASMKRNPELDKWMAIADFGGKLAAGSSPYFAQNFGPATTAGIAAYRGSEEAARENAMKEANSRLLQRQNDDANYRSEMASAVDMYQADKRYSQALQVAAVRASKGGANGYGGTPDISSYSEYRKAVEAKMMLPESKNKTMKQIEAEVLQDIANYAANMSASGIMKYQKGADGLDDDGGVDLSFDPSGGQ